VQFDKQLVLAVALPVVVAAPVGAAPGMVQLA